MEYNPDLPFYKRLHWQVLAAMILGSLIGVAFGEAGAEAIGWIGELFMRLLRMVTRTHPPRSCCTEINLSIAPRLRNPNHKPKP